MKRQLDDYYNKFYNKLSKRFQMLLLTTMQKRKKLLHGKKKWLLNGIPLKSFHATR